MPHRQVVWVVGYPRSGTVWLAWLLGDALNCPVYPGPSAAGDDNDYVTEGTDRPWPWVVRQGHFIVRERDDGLREPQTMTRAEREKGKIVYVVRDPRDLAVSRAFYWQMPVDWALHDMLSDEFGWNLGWKPHVEHWKRQGWDALVQYEHLRWNAVGELWRILRALELPTDWARILGAVERQDFYHKRKRGSGRYLRHKHTARTNVWPCYLTREMCRKAQAQWAGLLDQFGYIDKADWWIDLPDRVKFPKAREYER